MSERFLSLNDTDVDDFIEEEENINTKKKTELDLALVNSFIFKEKENRRLEEIPPQELDLYLSKFILAVKKKNGDEYEPTTLRGFISSIERYLKKYRYSESIITGQNFTRTREVLKSKQKQLKRLGKGNKPQEASSLTPEEIDVLFEKKQFGASSPKALINTLWFNNCLHFGLRGGKEQRDLNWGDIVLKADSSGGKFVVYVYIINRIIHSRLEIWNLFSCVQIEHLTRSLRSLVRYQFEHSKINSISPRAYVLFSIYFLFTYFGTNSMF